MDNIQNNQEKSKTLMYILVAFFVVFIVGGIFLVFSNKKTVKIAPQESESSTSVIPSPTATAALPSVGYMKLVAGNTNKKGDKISLEIMANSGNKNIVGYDVVFFYDPLAFDFVSADSFLSDYKVYSYKKGNYLTLTAIKSLSSSASPLNSKIVTLFFNSKKAGKYNFALKSSSGVEKTDMVTDKTEVLSPELNEINIEIK